MNTLTTDLKEAFEQAHAELTAILKPYKETPIFDREHGSITCQIDWKSNGGHQCSAGVGIWEENDKLVGFRKGSDQDEIPISPKEAMDWLRSELAIYKHEILSD